MICIIYKIKKTFLKTQFLKGFVRLFKIEKLKTRKKLKKVVDK